MNPVKLFISYAHEDELHKENLAKQLMGLKRLGVLETWDDRQITAGQEWDNTIKHSLKEAEIVVFLISPDFINSDYIHDVEIKNTLDRYKAGEQVIIPVVVRFCDFTSLNLSQFQSLPKDAKPITKWEDVDEAWYDVTQGIKKVIYQLRGETIPSEPYLVDKLVPNQNAEEEVSKITLHDFHQYTCNRRLQQGRFDELYETQQNNKVQFYYILGKEEQAHFGFVNRVAYERGGRLLDITNTEISPSRLSIEEIVLENISNLSHLKTQLIKKLLATFKINANTNDPILEKNLSFICSESPVVQKMHKTDYVAVQISIYEDEWDAEEIPELARWFIRSFCNSPLSENVPVFLFFFSIIYDEGDLEIMESVGEEIAKSEHILPLPELEKVKTKDLTRWFRKYKIIAPDKEVRQTIIQQHFSDKEEFDMEEVQRALKRIINDYNKSKS